MAQWFKQSPHFLLRWVLWWCLNSCFSFLRNKRQTSRRVAWCVVCKTRGVINALPAFWGWAHTPHEPAVFSLTRCNIAQLLFHIGFLICSKFESSLVRFFNVFKVPRNTEIFLVQKFVSKQMKNSKTYRVFESTLSTHDKIIRCYKRKLIVFWTRPPISSENIGTMGHSPQSFSVSQTSVASSSYTVRQFLGHHNEFPAFFTVRNELCNIVYIISCFVNLLEYFGLCLENLGWARVKSVP